MTATLAKANRTRANEDRAITAAAKRLPVRTPNAAASGVRRSGDGGWQNEAWQYFDDVPEVKFAARFLGAALSRLRLYPAIVVNPDDPPMALADAVDVPGSGVTAAIAAAAEEEFARLDNGEGMAGLQREFGVCLTIAGEANLVGRDVDGEEEWRVYSESAITTVNDMLAVKETPQAQGTPLADDDLVYRIWRRHSRWPGLADSNMRAILDHCEELLIIGRSMRATLRSRNNAGIVTLPNELDFAPARVTVTDDEDPDDLAPPAESDEDDLTDLERGMVDSFVTPTADDGSASQVAPYMLRGPKAALDGVRHISLERSIDAAAIPRLVNLISRLANGLDVPVEVLTGVADANHWTAWQIEDSTYKAHVEPLAQIPANGIATAFLRPALRLRDLGDGAEAVIKRIIIAIDPSALVVRPNRVGDAKDAFDRKALSFGALRQHLGFSEADAPSSDELLLRYTLERSIGGMGLTRDLFNLVGYEDVPDAAEAAEDEAQAAEGTGDGGAGDNGQGGDSGGDPTPDTDEGAAAVRRSVSTLLAAATSSSQIGERLAAIDARLRDRVQLAASDALAVVLARAGARLRAAAQGNPELTERLRGVANEDVGEALGDDGAALVGAEQLLSAADFALLGTRFAAWVDDARREALTSARRDAATHGVDPEQFDSAVADDLGQPDEDTDAGWALLLGSLLTLGRSRVFTPDGTPDDGEFDPHVRVPAGPVRAALGRAGGARGEANQAPSATGLGRAAGGPASGQAMTRVLARSGAVVSAYRWEVGVPANPFRPHHDLNGLVFNSWDDPALSSSSYGQLSPGDHQGCQCDAVPIIVYAADVGAMADQAIPEVRRYSRSGPALTR